MPMPMSMPMPRCWCRVFQIAKFKYYYYFLIKSVLLKNLCKNYYIYSEVPLWVQYFFDVVFALKINQWEFHKVLIIAKRAITDVQILQQIWWISVNLKWHVSINESESVT